MSKLDELLRSRGIPGLADTALPSRPPNVARQAVGVPVDSGKPIIHYCIQGTEEWARLRCGIPTTSQFHRIVTPTGKPSKSAEMYRLELLAERLTGEPTVGFTSHWMDRGSELEAEAVRYYCFLRDCETVKVGFVTNATGTIGASPDSLVGDSGLLEIKIGKPATQMGYLLQDSAAYEDYKIQAQGQLWVTCREWNDLLAYNPLMPPALYRAERDEVFIAALEKEVTAFSEELERQFEICVENGWAKKLGGPAQRSGATRKGQPKPAEPLPPLSELVKSALIEVEKQKAAEHAR